MKKISFKMTPMTHQLQNYQLTADKVYFGNVCDMGTGKSKMLLDVAAHMFVNGHINALIIFGNSGSYQTWKSEHIPLHMSTDAPYELAEWSSKLSGKKFEAFVSFAEAKATDKLKIITANIESLNSKRAFAIFYKFTRQNKTLAAIDESSTIRNPQSGRTKAAFKLRDVSIARRFLTGSPIDNKPLDIWAQLEFLKKGCSGYPSYYAFKAQFADLAPIYTMVGIDQRVKNLPQIKALAAQLKAKLGYAEQSILLEVVDIFTKAYNFKKVKERLDLLSSVTKDSYYIDRLYQLMLGQINKIVGYRNLDEFKAIINKFCFVVKSEDCLDLPEKTYMTHSVHMTDEQARIYKDLKEESLTFLNDQTLVTANMVLTRLLRLQQVVCGFVKDDQGLVHDIASHRAEAMIEVTEEMRGKVLIYAVFRDSIRIAQKALSDMYGADSVRTYFGDTTHEQRLETVSEIQHNDNVRFFITNHTGAYGLNLTAITNMISFCSDFDAEPRNQVEKRFHRIGQTRPCLYVDLITKGTVDERVFETVRGKRTLSESLIQSNWRIFFE
jgi:SNF2 family DNA or RNA helicase